MVTDHPGSVGNAGDGDDLRDRSLGELLKQLSEQTTQLVHQELELAKAEVTQKGKKAEAGAGLLGAAGAIGLAALGAFNMVMPAWLAALIVAVVYGAIAAFLALRGRDKVKQPPRWSPSRPSRR
jgi:hypothetical protein